MDVLIAFAAGFVVGVVLTIVVALTAAHFLFKLVDKDEDIRRLEK